MRILLTVSYDGSAYGGWQRQENAVTVQEVLEDALAEVFGRNISVTGASRTDAGVHALGQKAAFSVPETKIPPDKLPYVLNNALPADVVVSCAAIVPDEFHPRFDAVEKTYRYMYHCAKFPNPLVKNAWFRPHAPDAAKMDAAAKAFVGAHDFAAFCAAGSVAKTTAREIYECRVERVISDNINYGDELIALYVRGNGFLYNMVRIMAGTLLYVGEGKLPEDCVPGIIEGRDRARAGMTAPAVGLTLMEVRY